MHGQLFLWIILGLFGHAFGAHAKSAEPLRSTLHWGKNLQKFLLGHKLGGSCPCPGDGCERPPVPKHGFFGSCSVLCTAKSRVWSITCSSRADLDPKQQLTGSYEVLETLSQRYSVKAPPMMSHLPIHLVFRSEANAGHQLSMDYDQYQRTTLSLQDTQLKQDDKLRARRILPDEIDPADFLEGANDGI